MIVSRIVLSPSSVLPRFAMFSPAALVNLAAVSDEWLERTLDWAWTKRAPAKMRIGEEPE